jgi:hypothetical protein
MSIDACSRFSARLRMDRVANVSIAFRAGNSNLFGRAG